MFFHFVQLAPLHIHAHIVHNIICIAPQKSKQLKEGAYIIGKGVVRKIIVIELFRSDVQSVYNHVNDTTLYVSVENGTMRFIGDFGTFCTIKDAESLTQVSNGNYEVELYLLKKET